MKFPWELLREYLAKPEQAPTPARPQDKTPWLTEALKYKGVHEIRGGENKTILRFWLDGKCTLKVVEDEVPWCSAFHSAMYENVGIRSARSGWAMDYLNWSGGNQGDEAKISEFATTHVAAYIWPKGWDHTDPV